MIPLPEDEYVAAGTEVQQHRSSVRRRQLLPEVQVASGAEPGEGAPSGWTPGRAGQLLGGWLQAGLQRLRQALGGGQSPSCGAAGRGQNRWVEGDSVVPWYWRSAGATR